MTRSARITKADLALAAELAKTDGVAVTISANGKTFTVAPVDVKAESEQDDRKPKPWT